MKYKTFSSFVLLPALVLALPSVSVACDAWFKFDGNLEDAGGSGLQARMINDEGGVVEPGFTEGHSGRALQLGTHGAVRAYLDLHPDRCPQVTITAWIKLDNSIRRARSIVSTGSGHGPGIRASGDSLYLNGPANGLRATDAVRDDNDWMFVAGVWDFDADTYTIYWRTRSLDGEIGADHRPPEEALWIGAKNDHFGAPAEEVVIDDLRIIGRALTPDEVESIRRGG